MALKRFNPATSNAAPGEEIYLDKVTGDVWEAIGWITNPATILVNKRTGEKHVEVIGCRNAERWQPVPGETP